MPPLLPQLLTAGLSLALLASCGPSASDRPVVFAAASLAEVLQEAAEAYEEAGGSTPRFSFDATSRLARQLVEGAPADLFFSADARWMDEVEAAGLLDQGSRVDLLGNALVVAVRAGVSGPADPAALAAHPPERIALAGENVPAGRYADAALRSTGLLPALRSRVIRGHSVRSVLAWLARGDVPMAVVYASDVHSDPRVQVAFSLPAASHPPIVYVAAALRQRSASDLRTAAAAGFLRWCRGPAAQAIFRRAGFTVPTAGGAR